MKRSPVQVPVSICFQRRDDNKVQVYPEARKKEVEPLYVFGTVNLSCRMLRDCDN